MTVSPLTFPAVNFSPTCRRIREQRQLMPESFEPSKYSVLLGRGKSNINWFGNRRLRIICETYLKKYAEARNRVEKSAVVSAIVDTIIEACPQGGFYKKEDGRWFMVEDELARDKVGSILRDCLSDKYKSSTKRKIARRKERRQSKQFLQTAKRTSFTSVVSFTDSSYASCSTSDDMSTSTHACTPMPAHQTTFPPNFRRSSASGSQSMFTFDLSKLEEDQQQQPRKGQLQSPPSESQSKKSFDQCWSELIRAGARIQPIIVPTN